MRIKILLLAMVAATASSWTSLAYSHENGEQGDQTNLSPDMWFYQQYQKRYDDPQTAVRRKAEFRAQQRQLRIATRKWYGLSNSRPQVSPLPWTSTYGAQWQGNYYRPDAWFSAGRPTVILTTP